MRRVFAIASLLVAAATVSAQQHPCALRDGATYWMHERYAGIEVQRDVGDERQWVPNAPSAVCYRAPLHDIESPQARNWGYRVAIEEWGKVLPSDPTQWNERETVAIRTKLAALIGRDFDSPAEAKTWWRENGDYLAWSEEADRLVVDEAAKLSKQPVTTRDVEQEISASAYWRYEAKGYISDSIDDGTSIRGKAWTEDEHHPEIRFRIAKSELDDRQTKEAAYQRAVSEMVKLLAERYIGEQSSTQLRHALTRVTNRAFTKNHEWVNWWKANQHQLRLDARGLRLTTD